MIKHLTEEEFKELKKLMPHVKPSDWIDRVEYIGVNISKTEIDNICDDIIRNNNPVAELELEEAIFATDEVFDEYVDTVYSPLHDGRELIKTNLITKLLDENKYSRETQGSCCGSRCRCRNNNGLERH